MSKIAMSPPPFRRHRAFPRPPTAQDLTEAVHSALSFRAAVRALDRAATARGQRQERREDRRYPLRLPIIFDGQNRMGFGSSSDVSLGGMFIETDSPHAFGERITVKFRAAGLEQVLSAPAIVRWVEPGRGMGVQFESVRPIVIWALQQELRVF